jgi:hypothetical protein
MKNLSLTSQERVKKAMQDLYRGNEIVIMFQTRQAKQCFHNLAQRRYIEQFVNSLCIVH